MRNIVACVDFSGSTTEVIEIATALATALNTKLYLLHAAVISPSGVGFETVPVFGKTPAEQIHNARAFLNELSAPLKRNGVDVSTILREEHRSAAKAIVEEAQNIRADLLIVGSHGHGAVLRTLMGSTAAAVMHKSACPVLVVPFRSEREAKPAKDSSRSLLKRRSERTRLVTSARGRMT